MRFLRACAEILLITAIPSQLALCQSVYIGLASNFAPLLANAIARDAAGATFVGGTTGAVEPPTVPATPGAFQTKYTQLICNGARFPQTPLYCTTGEVAKFSSSGVLLWATYLGGTNQNGETDSDTVDKIFLDSRGNVWVSGHSNTLNFPITTNAYQKTRTGLFLAELSPDGSQLLYSSYTNGELLAIDRNDALYLAGISKFDPSTNRLVYSVPVTFTAVSGVVDDIGGFSVAGYGPSASLPVTAGAYSHPSAGSDLTVIAIDPEGQVIFATVLGGAGNDILTGMVRDAEGSFYLTGIQQAIPNSTNVGPFPDFPVTPDALQSDWNPAFLVKLSSDGSTLLYGSFLGKSNVEPRSVPSFQPADIKMGPDGKLRLVAATDQSDLNLTPDSFQPCYPHALGSFDLQRWIYVQFSSDLRAIEYATGIPGMEVTGPRYPNQTIDIIDGPFYFETTGKVYLSAVPFYTIAELNVGLAPPAGHFCLADYVTQTETFVAPGLLVSILGPDIGPDQVTPLSLDSSGRVATELAGTQVLFDEIPAPILSAGPNRIDAVVPFGITTFQITTISVLRNGKPLGTITNRVSQTAVKLFTVDGTGYGAAAWNQDGTPNSAANPAHLGEIVTFYGTGAGVMSPLPTDGAIPQSPQSYTTVGIGISPPPPPISVPPTPNYCRGTYSGDAPGLVEGIFQLNCLVKAVPLDVTFGVSTLTDVNVGPQIYTFYTK